ncbi:hypothetical protein LTR86_003956 [Recurvomyces mirabilis]|nr:hypothetical protein LTR86_003956 [Recurvomyces mirabilis]
MPIPFGVSVGDFIAGIGFVYDNVKCLEDSVGSQANYRGLVDALQSLRLALNSAKTATDVAERDSITGIINACEASLDRFWAKNHKYESHLGHKQGTSRTDLKTQWRKVRWHMCGKDEARDLQHELEIHISALNLLLLRYGHAIDHKHHAITMEVLQRMEGALQRQTQHAWRQTRMLLAIMVCLQQLGSKLQMGVAAFFLLQGQLNLVQKSIEAIPDRIISQSLACFVDAHGSSFTLDTRLTWTWETFTAILRDNHKNLPGLRRVQQGMYRLHNQYDSSEVDMRKPFTIAFRPGCEVWMSMTFDEQEIMLGSCPKCDAAAEHTKQVLITCSNCQLKYKTVQEGLGILVNNVDNDESGQNWAFTASDAENLTSTHSDAAAGAGGFTHDSRPSDFERVTITQSRDFTTPWPTPCDSTGDTNLVAGGRMRSGLRGDDTPNSPSEPSPTNYKGYFLRRDPMPGQRPDWSRVGKREIILDSAQLTSMIRNHLRGRPRALETAYNNLTNSQQGVVNEVIENENQLERVAKAEWILADVHRYGPERFGHLVDVTKIGVILQRRNRQEGISA